jgi:hypothetical protein
MRSHDYLRQVLGAFVTGQDVAPPPPEINWSWLETFALRQGLFAILMRQLPPATIPEPIFHRWQHAGIQVAMQNTRALAATHQVLARLEKAAISAAGMRGIVLAHLIYPDAMLRPMADVDLLIPIAARDAFEHLIAENAFGPVKYLRSQYVFGLNQTKFEVHWSLLTPKRYRSAADFETWVSHRRGIETPLGQLWCLCPEHELLGLICHWAVHHDLAGVLPAIDIARFIQSQPLDWAYIRRWCASHHLTRLVTFTLNYIDTLLNTRLAHHLPNASQYLPPHTDRVFAAYMARMWAQDTAIAAWRRRKNLFFLAESATTKLRQAIRMLDLYDLYRQRSVASH